MKLLAEPGCTIQKSEIPIEKIIYDSYLEFPSNNDKTQRWNITFIDGTATIPLDSESEGRFLAQLTA